MKEDNKGKGEAKVRGTVAEQHESKGRGKGVGLREQKDVPVLPLVVIVLVAIVDTVLRIHRRPSRSKGGVKVLADCSTNRIHHHRADSTKPLLRKRLTARHSRRK